MYPEIALPVGRGLGLALLALAGVLAWWNPVVSPGGEDGAGGLRGRTLALVPGLVGLALVVVGTVATPVLPSYGVMLGIGSLSGFGLCWRWARRRGLARELVLELALAAIVCGVGGARLVFVIEQWDPVFAARAPAVAGEAPDGPLPAGAELRLRTHAGEATIAFAGEAALPEVAAAIARQAGEADVTAEVLEALHRGADGVVAVPRGLVLRTGRRGEEAFLEVTGGAAADALGLPEGRFAGVPPEPLWRVVDLRIGGLTYFGAVLGMLLGWVGWARFRGAPVGTVLDVAAPVFPWGTAWGRVGCLLHGCCWGREAGDGALIAVDYPVCSPAWGQLAAEELSCRWDPVLNEAIAAGPPLPGELAGAVGPLAEGTPALHAAPLYEAIAVAVVFAVAVAFRRWVQRREGQTFALVVLLMCPLRFAVEHWRRDHDYFFDLVPGYPFTVTQTVTALGFLAGAGVMAWASRRGRPLRDGEGGDADPEAAGRG